MSDLTILEWCAKRRISKPTFYDLAKRGLAPETYEMPGVRGQRISQSADLAWEKRMQELKKSKEVRHAAELRKKAAQNAGRISAQSPMHVSKAGKPGFPKAPPPAGPKRPVGRPRKHLEVVT